MGRDKRSGWKPLRNESKVSCQGNDSQVGQRGPTGREEVKGRAWALLPELSLWGVVRDVRAEGTRSSFPRDQVGEGTG